MAGPENHLVREEACDAAWMIVQHDIGEPEFMRSMMAVFKREAARGELNAKWGALTEDRIRMFEERPQLYATNMNWNERGEMVVGAVEDPEHLDERRASVGLPPYHDPGPASDESPLKDPAEFPRRYLEWARRVGWQK
jgi:Family of unknown function (DUF6624)